MKKNYKVVALNMGEPMEAYHYYKSKAQIEKQYALDNCMSEKSKSRHLNNEIYIHDLDSYAVGSSRCLCHNVV